MIDIPAAVSYLRNALWNPDMGAFREATIIEKYYKNDNTLARIVMREHDPEKAQILTDGLLKDYADPRWCILDGNLVDFRPPSQVLPDYLRYADLVGLQYLYQNMNPNTDSPSANTCFGILSKMYGLVEPGFMFDMATPKEAFTMYKLLLYGMCAFRHNRLDITKTMLDTVTPFQLTPYNQDTVRNWKADEIGGIKTEYIPDDLIGQYPHLLVLANCETTSLAILLQEAYNQAITEDLTMIGAGVVSAIAGASFMGLRLKGKK